MKLREKPEDAKSESVQEEADDLGFQEIIMEYEDMYSNCCEALPLTELNYYSDLVPVFDNIGIDLSFNDAMDVS